MKPEQLVVPDMPYLSERGLVGLKNYQYHSSGTTALDDLHQPFWNWVVTLFPMWLAPNLITLLGTGGLVVGYMVSAYYLPEFQGVAPWWVYFLCGFAVLAYLHLDCLDGKQARRTKSSSPLGQLFDHGCDAASVHLITSMMAGTLSLGDGPLVVIGTLAIMIPWFAAQWEEYHTGLMLYGNGYWGVTEANYLLVIINWITAAVGPWLWAAPAFDVLPFDPPKWLHPRIASATVNEFVITFVVIFGLEQVVGQIYRVFKLTRNMLPVDGRGHKKLGRRVAGAHILQLTILFGLGAAVMSHHLTAPGQLRAQFAIFGIVYALQATRMIMTHMCKEPFEIFWWPVTIMVLVIGNDWLQLLPPSLMAWAAVGIILAGYLHYVVSVIQQICGFLGISCLTIPEPAKEVKLQ
mmetsp:Transcript_16607/g.49684  ORF Transcript_16607/g.49684 Transcript_16607/m.49684 type:complete len:406 (-) Transcript_16607:348-1565(-)|eukprot:CAMPEP_0206148890 /NCGR_PEP_ID=MMETSP1473-20131121/37490_1 /ASSEMBLY_ACC=CAM_ASM_001109 /TAXON_ID=1461547 /ORGANISM="Stichococcus sp, Strain RCC1054" /LENGTH=405 /DNA_ID=CAMNT_0053546323 /DNA_START=179 /DNA_END=1396 /DNA_ORIENTATION=+